MEVDTRRVRSRDLRRERQTDLTTTIMGGYSIAQKGDALSHGLRKSEKDERTLELLSCWKKLSVDAQEIILDIIKGLQAAAVISSNAALASHAESHHHL